MESLESGVPLDKIYLKKGVQKGFFKQIKTLAAQNKIPLTEVENPVFERLAPGVNHQGILASVSAREYDTLEDILNEAEKRNEPPFILALNEVKDPGNLGSLIRSAEGAGVHGIIIGRHRCAQLTPAVSKVSAGADQRMKITRVTNIADTLLSLRESGLSIVGADSVEGVSFFDFEFSMPLVIVLGGEEKGLGVRVKKSCDFLVKIPLRGNISSLNVGVSGGIVLFGASKFL